MSQQLVHHLLIIRMDLRDHVTGNEAEPGAGLPTVEAVCVFVSIYLESLGTAEHFDRLARSYVSPTNGRVTQSPNCLEHTFQSPPFTCIGHGPVTKAQ